MSRYEEYDLSRIQRCPIRSRATKVGVSDLGKPLQQGSLAAFLECLPKVLAARDLRDLISLIRKARERRRPIIWGFGGHLIKTGLGPVIIDLMRQGFVTALATNGSGLIHDFELAFCGSTSEDVGAELSSGGFGMAEETGLFLNRAIQSGAESAQGIGESVGQAMETLDLLHPDLSITLTAHRLGLPLTVHLAIGTDTIHGHPEACGEALGAGSLRDFRIFVHQVSGLSDGGIYLNIGSAVILPEVFLKAVSTVRSGGDRLEEFVTANFDFIQHYRPTQNVVKRPVSGSGRGFAFTGHHEIMIPLLAGLLKWD